jgi:hypothetical protein
LSFGAQAFKVWILCRQGAQVVERIVVFRCEQHAALAKAYRECQLLLSVGIGSLVEVTLLTR